MPPISTRSICVRRKVTALTTGGDVNLEPRWSPDGKRLAFVSTKGTGHYHIFIGDVTGNTLTAKDGCPNARARSTATTTAPIDQEESPTWSPDGKASSMSPIRKSATARGSIWRRPVDLSAPAKLVHREETSWKAAPDWSPDGKRVIFSSYARRQWNQLWIVTADGHDYPLPLTYGDWDITRPRWSPHAHRIAYVSNENKNTEIFIQEAIGGEKHKLEIAKRIYKRKMGTLQLSIVDADGTPHHRARRHPGLGRPFLCAGQRQCARRRFLRPRQAGLRNALLSDQAETRAGDAAGGQGHDHDLVWR